MTPLKGRPARGRRSTSGPASIGRNAVLAHSFTHRGRSFKPSRGRGRRQNASRGCKAGHPTRLDPLDIANSTRRAWLASRPRQASSQATATIAPIVQPPVQLRGDGPPRNRAARSGFWDGGGGVRSLLPVLDIRSRRRDGPCGRPSVASPQVRQMTSDMGTARPGYAGDIRPSSSPDPSAVKRNRRGPSPSLTGRSRARLDSLAEVGGGRHGGQHRRTWL